MAEAAETAIAYALLNRAQQFATANSITISLPNVAFTPPDPSKTAKWLRATLIPADSFALAVPFAARNQHYGFMQLDVFYGQDAGELAPTRIGTDIIAYFKRGTTMTKDGFNVQVTDTPRRSQIVKDDPWIMAPIRIPYLSFASPPA